ncbi:cytochrome b/b6 domain-containing protein [Pedobacter nototheniae]|uniref:cytochrome b/b6 domain-containing protein n=1 Tax=Pedobacter nototheniae TaxID=2488994 RepID=UPI00292DE4AD|nr:cytochrome b/b6 domain-containing protein [Pedobacter nototheniae]
MKAQKFNLAHRLIHWAIAFTILFMLLTVFLRLGWMNKDHLGEIVQQDLQKAGIKITKDQAASIGKNLRRPMWAYHTLAGYVMIALYLLRVSLIAIQGIAYPNPLSKKTSGKDKFKGWVYLLFYVLLATSLFTGFMVVNGPKNLKESMEFIHVKSLYYVLTFIILHIGGVLLADSGTERGIISKMISGVKVQ